MTDKPTIAVWFSCGAASAIAAKKTIYDYKDTHNIRVLNTPIAEEHPDNRRFLADVQEWLGVEIELVVNPLFPESRCADVWEHENFMVGFNGAPCTQALKREARILWEEANPDAKYCVLGFTLDEEDRAIKFKLRDNKEYRKLKGAKICRQNMSRLLTPLIDGGITKDMCFEYLNYAGIDLPQMYKDGFPNANCIGCVKATSPTYWNHVRKLYPEVFDERAAFSRKIGKRLTRVKNKRIFLDELDPDAKGRPLKSMPTIECGIFCETE